MCAIGDSRVEVQMGAKLPGNVHRLRREGSWLETGVKEAIYVKLGQPSLKSSYNPFVWS